jgi:serine protease inhibitor
MPPTLYEFNFFRLILINAIHLKCEWDQKFSRANTFKSNFHLANGGTIKTDMMSLEYGFKVADIKDIDARALHMPYKGNRLSMIFILPKTSLARTEQALSNFSMSGLEFDAPSQFEVQVPEFKIESTHHLKVPLINLGLTDMFNGEKANFTGKNYMFYFLLIIKKLSMLINSVCRLM